MSSKQRTLVELAGSITGLHAYRALQPGCHAKVLLFQHVDTWGCSVSVHWCPVLEIWKYLVIRIVFSEKSEVLRVSDLIIIRPTI